MNKELLKLVGEEKILLGKWKQAVGTDNPK